MKKIVLVFLLFLSSTLLFAKGLRHSVCVVMPEFTEDEKSLFSETSLFLSRLGKTHDAHAMQYALRQDFYGSGVVVDNNGLCLLTTRQVLSYASHATVIVYLHDKTLRFRGCEVLGTDEASGLALVRLPETDDLEALPFAEEMAEEGVDVSAAGFANLNKKPSWQLVHGFLSNAHLVMGQHTYLQHTVPFNPGMAGGPLLWKEAGNYCIAGINAGAVTKREDMALAVRGEEVKTAIKSGFVHDDNAELKMCTKAYLDTCVHLMKQMTEAERDSLVAAISDMPLDPIVHVLEMKEFIEKRFSDREEARLNIRGVVSDISRFKQNVFYHNYLSASNQEVGFGLEVALGKRKMAFLGMQFACSFTEAAPIAEYPYGGYMGYVYYKLYDPKPVFSPLFGLYTGFQLPIRVGNKHVLVPRISQGGNLGPCVNTYYDVEDKYSVGTMLITSDSRLGMEYHYQMKKMALIVAVEYTAHVFATDADVVYRYKDGSREPIDSHTLFLYENENTHIGYNCFNHGVGVRLALGF